jgi:hypothetical protein
MNSDDITNKDEVIKRKRGRKPKVSVQPDVPTSDVPTSEIPTPEVNPEVDNVVLTVVNNIIEEDIIMNTSVLEVNETIDELESDEPSTNGKVPKKRGRKPKGGKIIVNSITEETNVIHEPNIILHLKCKFSDLENNSLTYDCKGVDAFQFEKNKGTELGYHIIEGNMNCGSSIGGASIQGSSIGGANIQGASMHSANIHSANISGASMHNNTKSDNNYDSEFKMLCNKLKNMSYNLQNNNISDKKSDCFWCTCSFDNPPIYIPKHQINSVYQCYGCFCSPECATAFLFKESIDTSTRFERYYLLNHIYNKVYNYTKNIKPAPDPFYTLNKYYGELTIQEYRRLFKSERLLIVVDKPLSRILPELHEYNDDIMVQENLQNAGKFKIKRKTKQNKTDILNETFNIQ